MRVEQIRDDAIYLPQIKALGRANTETLGFFPDGAFEQYASHGWILAVLDDFDVCVAYLLYRISSQRAIIVHLCVSDFWRKRGLARILVNELDRRTQRLIGIGLHCRRDYKVNDMWPRLGFSAISEKRGRSVTGSELTFWWRSHNHPTLFTYARQNLLESKLAIVLDANIFFDLYGGDRYDESQALRSDWLQNSLELCVTDEINNEIHRKQDKRVRENMRGILANVTELPHDRGVFEQTYSQLRPLFPPQLTTNSASDLRQVAKAIAASSQFFVTRDQQVLDLADRVYEMFNLTIIRPSDLILHLDELQRQAEYQPARLAGTLLEVRRVHTGEQDKLAQDLYRIGQSESKGSFFRVLRHALSSPSTHDCFVAIDSNGVAVALIIYERKERAMDVPMFRVKDHPLGPTLARYLASKAALASAAEQRTFTKVTDLQAGEVISKALQESGFSRVSDGWLKVNIAGAMTAADLGNQLRRVAASADDIGERFAGLSDFLETKDAANDATAMFEVERALWPVKIIDATIPTFIVPIQARWAEHLFDEQLANETLFGADPHLALNLEAVYYRAGNPTGGLKSPGRILWYVSNNPHYHWSRKVRACSLIDEVVIGPPSDLFRRFRRLGVYEWANVREVAKRDLTKEIMAIRFSRTVLFPKPVSWEDLQATLANNGLRSQIQSPYAVSQDIFAQLYKLGTEFS